MIAPDKTSLLLPAGQVLTLTCSSDVDGTITELVGGLPATPVVVADAQTYGPYATPKNYRIEISVGTLTTAVAAYDPSLGATDVETAAAVALLKSAGIAFSAAGAGPTLKRGANGRCGTFVCNGATPVTVGNTSVAITDTIIISLNAVGGTVGAVPALQTITDATGFTVAGTAGDTSTYNYAIIKNAA